jgi:hypothetical protein
MFKLTEPEPNYQKFEYPGPNATEEELNAYFETCEKQSEEYAKWESENKWQLIAQLVFALSLIPIGAIFWGWDIVKERFQRGRRA